MDAFSPSLLPVPAESGGSDLDAEQGHTSPLTRDRSEVRDRTRILLSGLRAATPARRLAIRDEVVTLHLWLAASVARRYGPRSEFDDLVQVACGGLLEAFDRFDPEQSSYASFAWVTMSGLLRRHLRDHGWSVRPPRSLQESANVLRKTVPELTQELGRAPSTDEAAGFLGWTSGAVREAQLAEQGLRTTSTEALTGDGWQTGGPDETDEVETRVLFGRVRRALTDEERELLRLRFVEELTQAQIGALMGVNQMGVSRRLARLMLKLRAEIGELDDSGSWVGAAS